MSPIRACILLVDEDLDAREDGVYESGQNGTESKDATSQPSSKMSTEERSLALAVQVTRKWSLGQTLRVKFIGGTRYVRDKVQQYALQWTEYANIRFNFVGDDVSAEIRIAFKPGGSFSALGTDALRRRPEEPTMNFGWFNDKTSDEEFGRTVLHEFGHVLGSVHEHQQPYATIEWNKKAVYDYHKTHYGWDRDLVDQNVFHLYNTTNDMIQGTEFDSMSIMAYHIPEEWTINRISIPSNTRLSAKDIAAIGVMYPHDMRPQTGIFYGSKALPSDAHNRVGVIQPKHANHPPPAALLGLNSIGLDNPRNDGSVRDVTATGALNRPESRVGPASGWPTQRSSVCSWFDIPPGDNDIQSGYFKCSAHDHRNRTSSSQITFGHPYPTPPKVVVWLESFDAVSDSFRGLFVVTSDITDEGFRITIKSLHDTTLRFAKAVWLAYSSGRHDIRSGVFGNTHLHRSMDTLLQATSHWVNFDSSGFATVPQLFTAFDCLIINTPVRGTPPHIQIGVEDDDVTKNGFHWTMNTSLNPTNYEAGASYIAF